MNDVNEPIVKSARKARAAEPGPSIFRVLIISLTLAVILLGGIWLVFFRT